MSLRRRRNTYLQSSENGEPEKIDVTLVPGSVEVISGVVDLMAGMELLLLGEINHLVWFDHWVKQPTHLCIRNRGSKQVSVIDIVAESEIVCG